MFLCPTFQRPERLAELAESWERCHSEAPLWVRVWEKDPRKEDYFKVTWPKSWTLFESPTEWAGQALAEMFRTYPNASSYGFIADDIVLRTIDGIYDLEREAKDFFIAYPNDTLQRHRLCTHFCVGGDLARLLGFITPPQFFHHYMDTALYLIGVNTGLLRYVPHVIFEHRHFLKNMAPRDKTYQKVYGPSGLEPMDDREKRAKARFQAFSKGELVTHVKKVRLEMERRYEVGVVDYETLQSNTG